MVTARKAVNVLAESYSEFQRLNQLIIDAEENLDDQLREEALEQKNKLCESLRDAIAAIYDGDIDNHRIEKVARAASLGLKAAQLRDVCAASRVSFGDHIVLPMHPYAMLSRGRGWALQVTGSNAKWGRQVDNGYIINEPGKWIVGGHDGYSRKDQTEWTIKRYGDVWIVF